jgi:ABC-type oligopeptide transport system ATPase subunit
MLEAIDVSVALPDRSRKPLFGPSPLLPIIQDVDLSIAPGEAVGVVGESGSGKTTLGRTLLGLYRPLRGRVVFEGNNLAELSVQDLRRARLKIQMIFQDSQSSLNPRHRLVDILSGPFVAHDLADAHKARVLALELLERVGLEPAHGSRYPHELSGGQRQRVGIARAIALAPRFIVADEIVSGLDVSVQAQVLALLRRLRKENSLGMIFISHDLSVVRSLCDRVAVMQHGRIVEAGDCATVFGSPQHEYTRTLLRAIPLPVVDKHWLDGGPAPEEVSGFTAEAGRPS